MCSCVCAKDTKLQMVQSSLYRLEILLNSFRCFVWFFFSDRIKCYAVRNKHRYYPAEASKCKNPFRLGTLILICHTIRKLHSLFPLSLPLSLSMDAIEYVDDGAFDIRAYLMWCEQNEEMSNKGTHLVTRGFIKRVFASFLLDRMLRKAFRMVTVMWMNKLKRGWFFYVWNSFSVCVCRVENSDLSFFSHILLVCAMHMDSCIHHSDYVMDYIFTTNILYYDSVGWKEAKWRTQSRR